MVGWRWGLALGIALGQILPDTLDGGRWELQLEDQAEQAPEGIDWTQWADLLQERVSRPLDLNTASDEELLALPGMTPQLLQALRAHQKRYGPLLSIYELQAIPGFTEAVFETLRPYIQVRPAAETDIGSGLPQWPTWTQIKAAQRFTWIQRLQRTIVFTNAGGRWQEERLPRALGDPYRLYQRLWFQALPYLSVALIAEKDAYEPLRWTASQRYYGYDFVSGHIAVGRLGPLRRALLGDYVLQVGQGLVFARGLGFGKGGDPILTLKQPHYGLLPYSSVNEYQFWRGAALTYLFSPQWELTAMVSRRFYDATVVEDTVAEVLAEARTLWTGGLHRTRSEMARRQQLRQEALGGVLHWQQGWQRAGLTLLYERFTPPLALNTGPPYRFFGFAGAENLIGSLYWDATWANLNFFGEVAQSRSGGKALTASVLVAVHRRADLALQVRHFDPNYHSLWGYTFAERPFAPENEAGLYIGLRVRPTPRWEIAAFQDAYRFLWYRYRASSPTAGHEGFLQVSYTLRRRLHLYARVRYETKPYNYRSDTFSTPLPVLIPHQRAYVRLHGIYELSPFFRYQARLELSGYQRESTSQGLLLYQDVRWQPNFRWSLSLRWVLYRTTSYEARIYTYEAMPPTTFYIPGYYGEGQRVYALLRVRLSRAWTLWLRLGQNLFRPPGEKTYRRILDGLIQVRYQL
ncbi:MAG: helix-hairpin-helix domain-containing protein [Bacteroidia bacterium]|nr:helix-hairpin-helix domain-containing protein [Bacteroidia bacterium]MDW8088871.1 helix-hairpin-helix domain-containing protein [Bacteroidia bacterium]